MGSQDNKISTAAEKTVKKNIRKKVNTGKKKTKKKAASAVSTGMVVIWVSAVILGACGGFAALYLVSANDKFELRGSKNITFTIDGEMYGYKDKGATVIEFGRNISDKVKTETTLETDAEGNYIIDASEEGEYYIVYTVDSLRYGKIKRIRTITVVEGEQ